MERQLRHLTRLVDDLLDVADITRRGLPMEKTRVELSAVVLMALEQGRAQVEEAGHELSVSCRRSRSCWTPIRSGSFRC